MLGGKYLYAINVYPADGLVRPLPGRRLPDDGRRASSSRGACAVDAPKTGMRVEGVHAAARRSSRRSSGSRGASELDIGGIEYLVDDRDGKHYFYDINALSNFVADARERGRLRSVRAARRLPRGARRACRELAGRSRGDDAIRLLAAGLRRLAAQRRRRGDGRDVGVHASGSRSAASRSATTSRSIAELILNDIKGDRRAVARRVVAPPRRWRR